MKNTKVPMETRDVLARVVGDEITADINEKIHAGTYSHCSVYIHYGHNPSRNRRPHLHNKTPSCAM
jgi:hypothetical protein